MQAAWCVQGSMECSPRAPGDSAEQDWGDRTKVTSGGRELLALSSRASARSRTADSSQDGAG